LNDSGFLDLGPSNTTFFTSGKASFMATAPVCLHLLIMNEETAIYWRFRWRKRKQSLPAVARSKIHSLNGERPAETRRKEVQMLVTETTASIIT
jgi:hypothetical protein